MSPVSEFLSAHALKEKKVDPLLPNPEYSHLPAKIHIFPPKFKIPPQLFLERKMYFNQTFPMDSSNCQWDRKLSPPGLATGGCGLSCDFLSGRRRIFIMMTDGINRKLFSDDAVGRAVVIISRAHR